MTSSVKYQSASGAFYYSLTLPKAEKRHRVIPAQLEQNHTHIWHKMPQGSTTKASEQKLRSCTYVVQHIRYTAAHPQAIQLAEKAGDMRSNDEQTARRTARQTRNGGSAHAPQPPSHSAEPLAADGFAER